MNSVIAGAAKLVTAKLAMRKAMRRKRLTRFLGNAVSKPACC
jgi:hypothetical protein